MRAGRRNLVEGRSAKPRHRGRLEGGPVPHESEPPAHKALVPQGRAAPRAVDGQHDRAVEPGQAAELLGLLRGAGAHLLGLLQRDLAPGLRRERRPQQVPRQVTRLYCESSLKGECGAVRTDYI